MHQNEFRAQHISYTRYRIAPRWQDDFNWTLITKSRSDILLRDQYHTAVEWPTNRENQRNLPLGDNARVDVKLTSARYNKATAGCDTTKLTQLCTDIMLTKIITCGHTIIRQTPFEHRNGNDQPFHSKCEYKWLFIHCYEAKRNE